MKRKKARQVKVATWLREPERLNAEIIERIDALGLDLDLPITANTELSLDTIDGELNDDTSTIWADLEQHYGVQFPAKLCRRVELRVEHFIAEVRRLLWKELDEVLV